MKPGTFYPGPGKHHWTLCVFTRFSKQSLHVVVTEDTAVTAPESCSLNLPHNCEQSQQQLWAISVDVFGLYLRVVPQFLFPSSDISHPPVYHRERDTAQSVCSRP